MRVASGEAFERAGILERVRILSRALADGLPAGVSASTDILLEALERAPLPTSLFGDFVYAPFGDYVALKGCQGYPAANTGWIPCKWVTTCNSWRRSFALCNGGERWGVGDQFQNGWIN